MKYAIYLFILVVFSMFAHKKNAQNNYLLLKKYNKSIVIENLKEAPKNNTLIFNKTMKTFIYCLYSSIGNKHNTPKQHTISLKLPPSKINRLRVFRKTKTLLAVNNKKTSIFTPRLVRVSLS